MSRSKAPRVGDVVKFDGLVPRHIYGHLLEEDLFGWVTQIYECEQEWDDFSGACTALFIQIVGVDFALRTRRCRIIGHSAVVGYSRPKFLLFSDVQEQGRPVNWGTWDGVAVRWYGRELPEEYRGLSWDGSVTVDTLEKRVITGKDPFGYMEVGESFPAVGTTSPETVPVHPDEPSPSNRPPGRAMRQASFWRIAESARTPGPKSPSADATRLREKLEELPVDEIAAFAVTYRRTMNRLNRWSVWGAGYVIAGGMSDDSFRYFRSWLIGKGKTAVATALTRPDDLGEFVADGEEVENESLEYAAEEALEAKDEEAELNLPTEPEDPSGDPFDEETVYDQYPKLTARFASPADGWTLTTVRSITMEGTG